MLKKEIKEMFHAIRTGDLELVKTLIINNPEIVFVNNFAPPKKDDGQSTLQVAFKTGHFEIAELLIEKGADVNFIEKSKINEWKAPVIHDSIRAIIFNSYVLQKDTTNFKMGLKLLKTLLQKGADPNSEDSYGNNCLHRAILDSRQMLKSPNSDLENGILIGQLKEVFEILIQAGANPDESNEKRPSAYKTIENFNLEPYKLL